MTDVWARRFDPDNTTPLEADDPENISAAIQATKVGSVDDTYAALQLLLLDGELHVAPIPTERDPLRILHLGAGGGVWVEAMADKYPNASICGVEDPSVMNLTEPRSDQRLNCSLVVDNIENTDGWGKDSYDYINCHQRYSRIKDWDAFLENIFKHLTPGGWAELIEMDDGFTCNDQPVAASSLLKTMSNDCSAKLKSRGKEVYDGPALAGKLRKIGFSHVEEKTTKIPLSPWPKNPQFKQVGSYMLAFSSDPKLISNWLENVAGLSPEEAVKWTADQLKDLTNTEFHSYQIMRYVIAQK